MFQEKLCIQLYVEVIKSKAFNSNFAYVENKKSI